jgi:hypothetical protein
MNQNQEQTYMTAPKLLTKKDLRARKWTHRQIKAFTEMGHDGVIKTGEKGRPSFGFAASKVAAAERDRQSA